MRIETLTFSNFRCFENYKLGFKKGINLLFGSNGSGKTTILRGMKIECEVRNWKELDEALAEGCDRIMFDNFTPEDTQRAVEIVAGRCETESSGGITFDTMIPYAKAGVDFISFGALTHSVKGLDMSFKAAGSDKLIIK